MSGLINYCAAACLLMLASRCLVNVHAGHFDIDRATKAFESALNDRENLSLVDYIEGFKEMRRFLADLGILFRLVDTDIEGKVNGLDELIMNPSENAAKCAAYRSIRAAIEFEVQGNLVHDYRRPTVSRTLSRLQWALEFMSNFMMELSRMPHDRDTSYAARDVYDRTLARHHSWTVRMLVSFALRTLSRKRNLIESVIGKQNDISPDVIDLKINKLAYVAGDLWRAVERVYADNNLTDL